MKKLSFTYYLLPLLFSLFIFTSYFSKYVAYLYLIIILVIIILLFITQKRVKIQKYNSTIFSLIVFVFFLLLTTTYAVYPDTAIKTTLFTLCSLLPGLYIYNYRRLRNIHIFISVFYFFSFVFSTVTISSIFFPSLYKNIILLLLPSTIREGALFLYSTTVSAGITNQTGVNAWFSVLGLGIAFSKFCSFKKQKYIGSILFFTIAILFTGKRAHLLFSLLAIFFIYFVLNKKDLLKLLFSFFVFGFFLVVIFFLFPDITSSFLNRFNVSDGDISSGRFLLWARAVALFIEKPCLGWGFGYYARLEPIIRNTRMNVHNVYLQLLCETGVVGFLLFLTLLISGIKNSFVLFKKKEYLSFQYKEYYAYVIFSFFIQLFFIMYCFTGNPLNDLNIFSVYVFAISLVQVIRKEV